MAPGGRTPFTTDDDTLLVKYLAKYNPGVQGRSGNKIYQILVENEHNKWSWSARHPWGGWRERYTRHQDEFNARIKKYQTKKGLPMENSIYGNSTQKLKGSDEEAEPKRKRKQKASDEEEEIEITERKRTQDDEDEVMEEPKRKRKQRSSDEEEEEIMEEPKRKRTSADARKRAKVDVEENGADSPPRDDDDEMPEATAASGRHTRLVPDMYPDLTGLDAPRPKLKPARPAPKVQTRRPEPDPFEPVPPTPTTATASRPPTTASGGSVTESNTSHSEPKFKPKPRVLPKLIDGPYGTAFAGTRRRWNGKDDDDDEEKAPEPEWPPKRSRKAIPKSTNSRDERVDLGVTGNGQVSAAPPARRTPQQVNAVASSSRIQLPAASPRRPRPPAATISPSPARDSPIPTASPPAPRAQTPLQPPSSHRETPNRHGATRSPSPIDWGSEIGAGSPASARLSASPAKIHADRARMVSSPSKPPTMRPTPPPQLSPPPFEPAASDDRRSLPRPDLRNRITYRTRDDILGTGASRVTPRLSFTEHQTDGVQTNGGSPLNRDRSVNARRSRAPSPRRDARYRLPSPPRAGPSRAQSGTPLATKAKPRAHASAALPAGFKLTAKHPVEDARRHSLPAVRLPRIDFDSMRITAPRQSLPPPPPPHRAPLQRRHGSLFAPRTPASTSISPARSPASALDNFANDRAFLEQLGLQQAIAVMAANHRFDAEVVRNVYERTRNLAQTDKILLTMRETAEAAGQTALLALDAGDKSPAPSVSRHRRQHSSATASTAKRSPSSSQRKRRHADGEFRPQPLTRDVLAETEYSPPSSSRAGAIVRLVKQGRMEEGLLLEGRRASGGGTLSAFSRHAHAQARPDMEDNVPSTPPQFLAFAQGNVEVLREVERRDVALGMRRAAEVAAFMMTGELPSPYR